VEGPKQLTVKLPFLVELLKKGGKKEGEEKGGGSWKIKGKGGRQKIIKKEGHFECG